MQTTTVTPPTEKQLSYRADLLAKATAKAATYEDANSVTIVQTLISRLPQPKSTGSASSQITALETVARTTDSGVAIVALSDYYEKYAAKFFAQLAAEIEAACK